MVQVINFEAKEKGQSANAMVSVPKSLVAQVRKLYPEINLSATVRSALQEIVDSASKNTKK